MAILKGGLLQGAKGKLGNLVIRNVKGKKVVTVRPSKYKKTKSKKAKYVRSRFSIAVEFSKYINSIPILKEVWSNAEIKNSSAFNMIEKFNIKQVNDDAPSLQNIITPPMHINENICNFPFKSVDLNKDEIICTDKENEIIYPAPGAGEYTFIFILLFFEPKSKNEKYFVLDNIICSNYNLTLSGAQCKVILNPVIKKKISLYNKSIIYSASVIHGAGKLKYYSSFTFSKQFDLTSGFS